eukprot:TRINITY_DN16678_c0_g1_i3.p2 TRINITY_DN16678_c0_g1~~TRINITY_DN16678_c0_g1_i3.p2  ORF type:complete len:122 (-),score=23.93 TRINITY_DN16678_c0_g1_i3:76-441(-)
MSSTKALAIQPKHGQSESASWPPEPHFFGYEFIGDEFDQSMDKVSLPAGLQNLTFGRGFSMDKVSLPAGLQSLTFGDEFDQCMDKVSLPAGLQNLTFGRGFNQSMDKVSLPAACQIVYVRF